MDDSEEDRREDVDAPTSNRQLVFKGRTAGDSGPRSPLLALSSATDTTTASGRLRKKRKKSSWVWNHFQSRSDNIVCLACPSTCSNGENSFALSTSTSSLASHLKTQHKIEKNNGSAEVTQTTLGHQAHVQRHDLLEGEELSKCTRALARFIVDAKFSFNLVENRAFQSYVSTLNKHVPSISRRSIVRVIEDEHAERRPMIQQVIRDIDSNIAITCDGWSSRVFRGYFTVTAHWITADFDLKEVVLDFVYFPAPHNQWTTKAFLSKILHDFEIEQKVTAVTTDNGPEMSPAIELLRLDLNSKYNRNIPKFWHIRCACHIIHRGITDALEPLKGTMRELRSILHGLRVSQHDRALFKEAQKNLRLSSIRDVPGLDIENRWSSTFRMINKSYELKAVFESLSNDDRVTDAIKGKNLSEDSWENLKQLIDFLKLSAEITEMSSASDKPTVSIQYRIFHLLKKHCTDIIASTSGLKVV